MEGSFCDDIFACVDGPAGEAALLAAAPQFDCSWGEDPLALCSAGQTVRDWITPGILTAADARSVCAATVSTPAALQLLCVVWE